MNLLIMFSSRSIFMLLLSFAKKLKIIIINILVLSTYEQSDARYRVRKSLKHWSEIDNKVAYVFEYDNANDLYASKCRIHIKAINGNKFNKVKLGINVYTVYGKMSPEFTVHNLTNEAVVIMTDIPAFNLYPANNKIILSFKDFTIQSLELYHEDDLHYKINNQTYPINPCIPLNSFYCWSYFNDDCYNLEAIEQQKIEILQWLNYHLEQPRKYLHFYQKKPHWFKVICGPVIYKIARKNFFISIVYWSRIFYRKLFNKSISDHVTWNIE